MSTRRAEEAARQSRAQQQRGPLDEARPANETAQGVGASQWVPVAGFARDGEAVGRKVGSWVVSVRECEGVWGKPPPIVVP
ncbi:MAG: hypothetical protein IPL99_08885 [Candidatus Competibacteraceae bacterium]|nr:hypothetical protein [Candidatus Competibacteraceae bacterium]